MSSSDSTKPDPPDHGAPGRPLRADARRNRDRLIEVARAALTSGEGTFSLEAVARDAGVGIGTLYRHFPTRDALVEAVYASELDDVTATAGALLERLPPDEALREWMVRYAEFAATKRGMIDTLKAGMTAGISPSVTRRRIGAAISPILEAGARAGSLRTDVRPDDVVVLLLGAFLANATTGDAEQTGRLLDLVLDALRPPR